MDALTLLKADHKQVERLFQKFEESGPRALKTKEKLVRGMIEDLSVHAVVEEQIFYPAVRAELADLDGDVLEAIEEHHIVKWTLSELEGLDPDAENFTAKVTVLIENVRHHVKEEEEEMFPAVRQGMPKAKLAELGAKIESAKKVAPTDPHPRGPSTPPTGNAEDVIANVAEKMLTMKDKVVEHLKR